MVVCTRSVVRRWNLSSEHLRFLIAFGFAMAVLACGRDSDSPKAENSAAEGVMQKIESEINPPLTPDHFFEIASSSVVLVTNPHAGSLGSGVEIKQGVFVTNCHVLEAGSYYVVRRGPHASRASLKAADRSRDVCLLAAELPDSRPANLRSAGKVRVGETVYVIGNPQGLSLSLSDGIVSQLRFSPKYSDPLIQITAPISRGSSGGGVFDSSARLIGISTFAVEDGQNLNFAVPVDWALDLLSEPLILKGGFSESSDEDASLEGESQDTERLEAMEAQRLAQLEDIRRQRRQLEEEAGEAERKLRSLKEQQEQARGERSP